MVVVLGSNLFEEIELSDNGVEPKLEGLGLKF